MTSAFSWQNSVSLCPASFCTPRPNLPVNSRCFLSSYFCIPVPKKGNAKECSNYCIIALMSHASKVMLKILQARLQQYVNRELPDVKVGFRKGRGSRDQIANIPWIIEKESSRKTYTSALLTMPKPLTVWITINCGKL